MWHYYCIYGNRYIHLEIKLKGPKHLSVHPLPKQQLDFLIRNNRTREERRSWYLFAESLELRVVSQECMCKECFQLIYSEETTGAGNDDG